MSFRLFGVEHKLSSEAFGNILGIHNMANSLASSKVIPIGDYWLEIFLGRFASSTIRAPSFKEFKQFLLFKMVAYSICGREDVDKITSMDLFFMYVLERGQPILAG